MRAVGLSLEGKYILLDDDTTLSIVEMMDINGDDTTDITKCIGVVYQRPDGAVRPHMSFTTVNPHRAPGLLATAWDRGYAQDVRRVIAPLQRKA